MQNALLALLAVLMGTLLAGCNSCAGKDGIETCMDAVSSDSSATIAVQCKAGQTKSDCVKGCCNLASKEVMDGGDDTQVWDITPTMVSMYSGMCTGDNAVTDPCHDEKVAVAIGAR